MLPEETRSSEFTHKSHKTIYLKKLGKLSRIETKQKNKISLFYFLVNFIEVYEFFNTGHRVIVAHVQGSSMEESDLRGICESAGMVVFDGCR